MLRNCVILVHTNMLDATHPVQTNMKKVCIHFSNSRRYIFIVSCQVEVDATSLRTFRIGPGSKAFRAEIEKWKKLHPSARKRPSYFLCHLRIAGCLERREDGRVLLKDLPLVALAPGSRPPTESVQDVQHTGFFQAVVKSAHTFACWRQSCMEKPSPCA